jgi:deoxycytidylate deaminase
MCLLRMAYRHDTLGTCSDILPLPPPSVRALDWDTYFMALAFLTAQRSKDPNKQVDGRPDTA